jgi:flagellar basal body-associated protein FliL
VHTGYIQESRPTAECSLAAAVSSSVLTLLVVATVMFIIGLMIGRYLRFSKGKFHITTTDQSQQGPVYDYIQPSTVKPEENLELKVNVAYHPTKSVTIEQ